MSACLFEVKLEAKRGKKLQQDKIFRESYFLNLSFLGMDYFGITASQEGQTLLKELEEYLGDDFSESLWLWPGSRLDSGVSAVDLWIEIVLKGKPELLPKLIEKLKQLKSPTIQIHRLLRNTSSENLIASLEEKTYRYFILLSENSVQTAPCALTHFSEKINFSDWVRWVKSYEGVHHFKAFSIRTKPHAIMKREVTKASAFLLSERFVTMSSLEKNRLRWLGIKEEMIKDILVVEISAQGFLRGQVRMMIGALLKLSKNELSEENFLMALDGKSELKAGFKVPSYGLVLWQSKLKNHSLPILLDLDSPPE